MRSEVSYFVVVEFGSGSSSHTPLIEDRDEALIELGKAIEYYTRGGGKGRGKLDIYLEVHNGNEVHSQNYFSRAEGEYAVQA